MPSFYPDLKPAAIEYPSIHEQDSFTNKNNQHQHDDCHLQKQSWSAKSHSYQQQQQQQQRHEEEWFSDSFRSQQQAIYEQILKEQRDESVESKSPAVLNRLNTMDTYTTASTMTSVGTTNTSTTTNNHSDHSIQYYDLLQDSTYIQEQQRLWQELQSQNDHSAASPPQQRLESLISSYVQEPNQLQSTARRMAESYQRRQPAHNSLLDTASTIPTTSTASISTKITRRSSSISLSSSRPPSTHSYSKTHNLRVRGTDTTYQAIADGTATIVTCSNCSTILQVASTTKLVYCTHCEELTMLDHQKNSNHGDGARDSEVACALQRQEVDVALARKTAAMLQTRSSS